MQSIPYVSSGHGSPPPRRMCARQSLTHSHNLPCSLSLGLPLLSLEMAARAEINEEEEEKWCVSVVMDAKHTHRRFLPLLRTSNYFKQSTFFREFLRVTAAELQGALLRMGVHKNSLRDQFEAIVCKLNTWTLASQNASPNTWTLLCRLGLDPHLKVFRPIYTSRST